MTAIYIIYNLLLDSDTTYVYVYSLIPTLYITYELHNILYIRIRVTCLLYS